MLAPLAVFKTAGHDDEQAAPISVAAKDAPVLSRWARKGALSCMFTVGRLGLEPRTYGLTGRGRSRAPQGSAAGKQRLGLRRSSRRFAWLRSHWAPNLGSRNAT